MAKSKKTSHMDIGKNNGSPYKGGNPHKHIPAPGQPHTEKKPPEKSPEKAWDAGSGNTA